MLSISFAIFAIILASFVSEDVTCIATGLAIHDGHMNMWVGVLGCTLGIYVGDLLLFFIARYFGRPILRWKWVAKRVPRKTVRKMSHWIDQNMPAAVITSRFVPTARLPMFVAAGLLARRWWAFLLWTFIAALLWTPALVLLVAWQGETIVAPFRRFLGAGWLPLVAAVVVLLLLLKFVSKLFTRTGRRNLAISFARMRRLEFWPAWFFYLPLIPYVALLMTRYGFFTTITAANPGIPHGGFAGESKSDILKHLDPTHVLPWALIPEASPEDRFAQAQRFMTDRAWTFPIILKPDAGERGSGLKLARNPEQLRSALRNYRGPMIIQVYHPGPYEAGVFYYRVPGEPAGHIYSITDKTFPQIQGDGVSTLEQLIYAHPRFRLQADTFLARYEGQETRVLAQGETMRLAIAGNHCQGTLFRDGSHLITPALTDSIDKISHSFEGFFFGRFDIRYSDPDAFRNGTDIHIIELNGITSESTNLYDPDLSIASAYKILFGQWRILFQVGAANRKKGIGVSSLLTLYRVRQEFVNFRRADALAD